MSFLDTPQQVTRVAFLASVGIALFVIESFVPLPVPFLKLGFANISSVIALELLGPIPMLLVMLIRVVAGSLLTGSLFSPAFLLAFAGGVASASAMALCRATTGRVFSVVGLSLVGSTTHVLVQLLVVRFLYVQSGAVLILLPLLLGSAIVGGLAVGFLSARLLDALHRGGVS